MWEVSGLVRSNQVAVGLAAIVFALLCGGMPAGAAEVDQQLHLERFRPGYGGPEEWMQMYPVPQREPVQAYG